MKIYVNPPREAWAALCERPAGENPVVRDRVAAITERVRTGGDRAIREIEAEIVGGAPDVRPLAVSDAEIAEAITRVPPGIRAAVEAAAANIRAFHAAQLPSRIEVETAPGVRCIQKPVPIRRVGLYIPGGTAPLFSTVLMLAIPAKTAGCEEVVLCTPTSHDGSVSAEVLYAAHFCGVDRIFRAGGAQAIAAMAYGTESIPKVDKIFGPGNQYVTAAKQLLGGRAVAIDMPAGPSEVMVIADSGTPAAFVAADLLSQAEHGPDSQVVLVCDEASYAESVQYEVERQTEALGRRAFVEQSLSKSLTVVLPDTDDAIAFAEQYAPEHLIISTFSPWSVAERITAAGSVFVGAYTPESAGDYASGTNHTLPTCGWAHAYSGVNIDAFMRKMTLQAITREGLRGLGGTIVAIAEAEGLQAHANAVNIRLSADEDK